MNAQLQRLQTVIELAEQALDQAGETLHAIQEQLTQTDHHIQSLEQYLEELSAGQTSQPTGVSVTHFQSRLSFMHKVQTALQQERNKRQQLEEAVAQARQQWLEKRSYLKSLQKMAEKRKQEHQKILQKREQSFQDDLTNARQLRNKN